MVARPIDVKNYNVLHAGNPAHHHNLAWYANDDDSKIGVVILDKVDMDFSWVTLKRDGNAYKMDTLSHSLPTELVATTELCKELNK